MAAGGAFTAVLIDLSTVLLNLTANLQPLQFAEAYFQFQSTVLYRSKHLLAVAGTNYGLPGYKRGPTKDGALGLGRKQTRMASECGSMCPVGYWMNQGQGQR